MRELDQRALDTLSALGAHPAVPFHENGPAGFLMERLKRLDGVETSRDAYGNVVAHYARPLGRSEQPPTAFVAHMDHPGFEIISPSKPDGVFTARVLGGVPVASMTMPTPLLVLTPDGRRVPAETCPDPNHPAHTHGADRRVEVRLKDDARIELPVPAFFDLPDFVLDGETIRMRALDDLAGCASILSALERVVAEGAETNVYAVFTRAEEDGLFGARLMAEAGTLPQETLVVSVESSPVIPGVAQGGGPVIRTGDAMSTFDNGAEAVLIAARQRIKTRDPKFESQRQLMSGGTCEGTAFAAFGYRVTGLAFPLGNYHNATTRIPDPDGGVDAEYIRLADYLGGVGGVEFIAEAARGTFPEDDLPSRHRLQEVPDEVRQRLMATSAPS